MEKKITIAIYSGTIPAPNFVENLVKLVGDKNINIFLFGSGKNAKYRNLNIKIFSSPKGKIKIIFFVFFQTLKLLIFYPKKLFKLIKNHKVFTISGSIFISLSKILPVLNNTPDIFHIQWAKSLPFWFFLKEIYGVKIVLSLRGSHVNYSAFADDLLARKYNALFPKVDKMHAVSNNLLIKAKKYGAKTKNIDVIYSSLDFELLKKYEKTIFTTHKPFRFLSVGRFHWVKGYHYSISAIANLKKIIKKIHYLIITSNSVSEEILHLIDDLSLKNNVEIIHPDSQEHVYEIMRESDCLILPSVQEGISNVVLESMSIGLPVVTSDCGGMKEVISYGKNGFYFSVRNLVDLEKQLLKVINLNVKEREKIIKEARCYINSNLDPNFIKSEFHNLYKKTMGMEY